MCFRGKIEDEELKKLLKSHGFEEDKDLSFTLTLRVSSK